MTDRLMVAGEAHCSDCGEMIAPDGPPLYVPTRDDAGGVVYVAVSPDAAGGYGTLPADADVFCWRCAPIED
jgi:hypothetical protein